MLNSHTWNYQMRQKWTLLGKKWKNTHPKKNLANFFQSFFVGSLVAPTFDKSTPLKSPRPKLRIWVLRRLVPHAAAESQGFCEKFLWRDNGEKKRSPKKLDLSTKNPQNYKSSMSRIFEGIVFFLCAGVWAPPVLLLTSLQPPLFLLQLTCHKNI